MSRVSRKILGLLALAIIMLSGVTMAEEARLEVEINKGKRVTLPASAASVVAANPDIADVQVVSPRVLYIYGKKIGETSVMAVDAYDNTIYDTTVTVSHNLSDLERTVKETVPDADVDFKTVDGGLVMEGNAATVGEAEKIRNIAQTFLGEKEKLVNMIKTAGSDQVMLKVKFVEMSRSDLKNIGINLQNITNHGNFSMQLLQGSNLLYLSQPTGSPDFQQAPGLLLDRGSSTNTNALLRYKTLTGVIDALETQGLANVLAEPTLSTTSGQTASFLAGGQFPVPAVQANSGGAPTVTIQYQPFGVSLKFTPVVMSKDRISLTVNPEVSTLDFNNPIAVSGITYPILDTRQASAVVELGSGESFMLAGLMQNTSTDTINKFPGLGDLPVLGALVRSTSFQNDETELVILVTPYIVHPVAANKLQTPLDGYKPPSDLEVLLKGSLYRQEPMDVGSDMPKLSGDGGFMLDEPTPNLQPMTGTAP